MFLDVKVRMENQQLLFWPLYLALENLKVTGKDTSYLSVFSPNTGKYGPENIPYFDTFNASV